MPSRLTIADKTDVVLGSARGAGVASCLIICVCLNEPRQARCGYKDGHVLMPNDMGVLRHCVALCAFLQTNTVCSPVVYASSMMRPLIISQAFNCEWNA